MFERKKDRFSIRKFKVGVGSVFLGSFLIVAPQVYGVETTSTNPESETIAATTETTTTAETSTVTMPTDDMATARTMPTGEETTNQPQENDARKNELYRVAEQAVTAAEQAASSNLEELSLEELIGNAKFFIKQLNGSSEAQELLNRLNAIQKPKVQDTEKEMDNQSGLDDESKTDEAESRKDTDEAFNEAQSAVVAAEAEYQKLREEVEKVNGKRAVNSTDKHQVDNLNDKVLALKAKGLSLVQKLLEAAHKNELQSRLDKIKRIDVKVNDDNHNDIPDALEDALIAAGEAVEAVEKVLQSGQDNTEIKSLIDKAKALVNDLSGVPEAQELVKRVNAFPKSELNDTEKEMNDHSNNADQPQADENEGKEELGKEGVGKEEIDKESIEKDIKAVEAASEAIEIAEAVFKKVEKRVNEVKANDAVTPEEKADVEALNKELETKKNAAMALVKNISSETFKAPLKARLDAIEPINVEINDENRNGRSDDLDKLIEAAEKALQEAEKAMETGNAEKIKAKKAIAEEAVEKVHPGVEKESYIKRLAELKEPETDADKKNNDQPGAPDVPHADEGKKDDKNEDDNDALKKLVDKAEEVRKSNSYKLAEQAVKTLYDDAIAGGKAILDKEQATETEVKNSIAGINQYLNSLSISAAREAVKEAKNAAKAGLEKKSKVEKDGVTKEEKDQVDALNKVTNEKKAIATALVNSLTDRESKMELSNRLEEVKPVDIEVTKTENDNQADDVNNINQDVKKEYDEAKAAVAEAEKAAQDGITKRDVLLKGRVITKAAKKEVDDLNVITTTKKELAQQKVDVLKDLKKKAELEDRLKNIELAKVEVNDDNNNGIPDVEDKAKEVADATAAVEAAERLVKELNAKLEADMAISEADKSALDDLNTKITTAKNEAKEKVSILSEDDADDNTKQDLLKRVETLKTVEVKVNDKNNNNIPDDEDEAFAQSAVQMAEASMKKLQQMKKNALRDEAVNPKEKKDIDDLKEKIKAEKATAELLVNGLSNEQKKNELTEKLNKIEEEVAKIVLTVNDKNSNGRADNTDDAINAIEEAEKAAKAAQTKKSEIDKKDTVTQHDKAELEKLNAKTKDLKEKATNLVNELPNVVMKGFLRKRLESVATVDLKDIEERIKRDTEQDTGKDTNKGTDQDSNNGTGKEIDKGTENGTENGIEKDSDKDTGKEPEKEPEKESEKEAEPEQDKEQDKEEDSNKGTENDKEKDTEPKTDTEDGTKPNTDSDTGSDTDSDKKQDSDQGTEPNTDSNTNQDSEQSTKPKTEDESKKDTDAQSDAPDTDNKEAKEAAAKVAAEKAVAEAEKAANAAHLKLFELKLNNAISSEDKRILDELDNVTNASKKAAEELVNKVQDEAFKKGLQERLAKVNPVNAEVNDTNNNGIPDAVDNDVKTAEAAVKAAQAAVSEAQAKLKDAQSNGEVTQEEKDGVDKLNEKITAEKEKATDLVNKLPEYVNKVELNKQLNEITTVNAVVTKKDNDVKPDAGVQPNGEDAKTKAAEAAAEKAVAEAEAAGQAAQAKKEAVEANNAVNQAEKNEVTRLNNDTVSKKEIAKYLVSELPNGEKKAALERRLAAVKTVEVDVNDENDNGKPDSQDRAEEEAIAEKAVVEAEAAAKVAEMKKADVLKDKVVTKAEKAEVDKLNKETEAKKAAAKQLVEKLSEGAKKEALFARLAGINITTVEVNEQDNNVKPETPKAPSKPSKPVQPATPKAPEKPAKPEQPKAPEKPEKPATPKAPAKPVEPEQPKTPEKPVQPAAPKAPEKPEKPATPKAPEKPVEPEQPKTPEKPVQPATPKAPAKPVQPATPKAPAKPVQPAAPKAPEVPKEESTPEKPAAPGQAIPEQQGKKESVHQQSSSLPNTGEANSMIIWSAAAFSILTGLGFVVTARQKEDEEA
ncbi:YSIRK-type signal peptide-containing protein [Aerococcaceae bacterium zg-BR22]|uniref:GA-like domain-containing protein n=1 Tax=Aerococcaceae bacterium zg-1292 TaxID=2774330 RepID=UPI004062B8BC|nr:YSIRK-type signal peptide-containing protein [Aerococcaceae bacterium zg-BR22]